jgi:hypothetical protein
MNFSQQRSMMQEHHSKPATRQPASTSKHTFNGGERRNPLTFKFFENVLNVVRLVEPKAMHVQQALDKGFLKWL